MLLQRIIGKWNRSGWKYFQIQGTWFFSEYFCACLYIHTESPLKSAALALWTFASQTRDLNSGTRNKKKKSQVKYMPDFPQVKQLADT